jgi:hypothetical protein
MTAEAHSATAQRDPPRSQWRWRGTFPPRSSGAAGTPTAAPANLPEWELSL